MSRMIRVLLVVLLVLPFLGFNLARASALHAQTVGDPASAAIYYSELEAAGLYSEIYAYLHPDAQAIIPEAAVVGWYANEFGPLGPGVITVSSVVYVSWTWPVTGHTYPVTAEVSFRQSFANGTVVDEVVRLVEYQGEWRWFFGRSREFVDTQIARYASSSNNSCEGATAWWADTFPRLVAIDLSTPITSMDIPSILSLGEAWLRQSAATFASLHLEQTATDYPPAAAELQMSLLSVFSGFEATFDVLADVSSGTLHPLWETAALQEAERQRSRVVQLVATLDTVADTFVDECDPIVVFVYGVDGVAPPVGIQPGDPIPPGYALTCEQFASQAKAQQFFDASGPSDTYGLDPDGDGVACEEGV
jgi:hypothetical protein